MFSRTLTANIRTRRGSKVNVNLPLFRDIHTDMTAVDGAGEACSDCTCSGDAASSASHAEACEDSKGRGLLPFRENLCLTCAWLESSTHLLYSDMLWCDCT